MKPSEEEVRSYVERCPECGHSGWALWYLPEDLMDRARLQLVVHHGLGPNTGWKRNDFHYMPIFRDPRNDEIIMAYRANPRFPPDDYPPAYAFLHHRKKS